MTFGSFDGMRVTVSVNATKRAGPHWPIKWRSKRLHKKLTKKRGPQFTEKPAVFRTQQGLIVHPAVWAELKRHAEATQNGEGGE